MIHQDGFGTSELMKICNADVFADDDTVWFTQNNCTPPGISNSSVNLLAMIYCKRSISNLTALTSVTKSVISILVLLANGNGPRVD